MTLRCKPGDLAIVEKDDPPCLGNVRHVVRVIGDLEFDSSKGQYTWLIEPLSTPSWWLCQWPRETIARQISRAECLVRRVEHADEWLRPIRKTGFESLAEIISHIQNNSEYEGADIAASIHTIDKEACHS